MDKQARAEYVKNYMRNIKSTPASYILELAFPATDFTLDEHKMIYEEDLHDQAMLTPEGRKLSSLQRKKKIKIIGLVHWLVPKQAQTLAQGSYTEFYDCYVHIAINYQILDPEMVFMIELGEDYRKVLGL